MLERVETSSTIQMDFAVERFNISVPVTFSYTDISDTFLGQRSKHQKGKFSKVGGPSDVLMEYDLRLSDPDKKRIHSHSNDYKGFLEVFSFL